MRRVLLVTLLFGVWAPTISAQDIGDQVKVRRDGVWVQGWLETLEPDGTFFIRDRFRDPFIRAGVRDPGFTFRVSNVLEADWYKPRPLVRNLLVGTAAVIAFETLLPCSPVGGTVRGCFSDDRAAQYAIEIGIVAAFTLFVHAVWPARWTQWIRNGLVLP